MQKKQTALPPDLTYLAAFLTFRCNFRCSFCINHYKTLAKRRELTADEWIEGLNRLSIIS